MKLEGKVAIVTGGGRGIGRGIVNCLAEEGADVAIIDIIGDNARKAAAEVVSVGRKAMAVEADLVDGDKVKGAVQNIISFFGRVDILVNNAGAVVQSSQRMLDIETWPRFVDRDASEWDKNFEVNLKTQILMCHSVIPHLMQQRSGKIVNIASDSARTPDVSIMSYGTAKAGVVHFTRMLARDLAPDNINVNCICPGLVYTPLFQDMFTNLTRLISSAKVRGSSFVGPFAVEEVQGLSPRELWLYHYAKHIPLRREQTPEDIGRAVVFFASDDAKNITGQTLGIDGGLIMT